MGKTRRTIAGGDERQCQNFNFSGTMALGAMVSPTGQGDSFPLVKLHARDLEPRPRHDVCSCPGWFFRVGPQSQLTGATPA